MPSWAEIRILLGGAVRLAKFDIRGLDVFGNTPKDAGTSFYAAVLVAPMYLLWANLHGSGLPEKYSFLHTGLFETLSYAVGWMIFPLCMWYFSGVLDCRKRFFHFLTAYNWVSVIQNGLFMGMDLLFWMTSASDSARGFFGMVLLVYVLIYGTFVARTALALPLGQVIAVVVLDTMTAMLWRFFSDGLSVAG